MTYLQKSKNKWERFSKIIIIFVIFLSLSLLAILFPNFTRQLSSTISRPVWTAKSLITGSLSGIKDFLAFKSSLIKENIELKDRVAQLELKVTDHDILEKEIEDLRMEVGRVGNSRRFMASILSKPPNSPYDTLLIDAGTSLGLQVGDKVYLSENIIIGTVMSVTDKTSVTTLFSSSGQKQRATLLRTGTVFELSGRGGANFIVEVPKESDILVGDIFIYPGILQSVISNVYYIDANSQSSFKTVYLRIPGNVFSAKHIFIEKP